MGVLEKVNKFSSVTTKVNVCKILQQLRENEVIDDETETRAEGRTEGDDGDDDEGGR